MSKTGYQFKEDILVCTLCSKNYTNPRILPCLHSFCSECLNKHVKGGLQKSQDDPKTTQGPRQPKQNGGIKAQGERQEKQNGRQTKQPSGRQEKQTVQKDKQAESRDGASVRQAMITGFPCPCCKKFATTPALPKTATDKWAELFPENNLLADLVDLHTLKLGTRVCDPCKRNKTTAHVHSYCKNCRDALCEPCMKTHKGLRSCRNHKVLTTSQFSDAIHSLKVEEEFCSQHEDKVMDHYCYTHSTLCCSKCLAETHKNCERVSNVADAANKCKDTNSVAALDGALHKYKSHIDIVLKDRSMQLKKLGSKKSKLMDEFIQVKNHVISQLEKMEKDLRTILESTHRQETRKVQHEVEKCQEIQSAVINSNELLTVANHHGANSQVVDTVQKVRTECEYYEESIGILCSRIRTVDYDIVLDASLQQIMKRLNQFGRIDVNTTPPKLPPPPKLAGSLGLPSSSTKTKAVKPSFTLSGKHAKEIGEFCARFEDDSQDCWFTGANFLPDGRILLADRTNRKLKLFTSNFRPIVELLLPSKPWDVTVISDKEIAVSLPAECRIQFVSVQECSLTQTRTISTDEPCFGVHYVCGKILTVTYDGDPPNLKILSPNGQELTYVCVDDDGFTLFSKPVYVTSTADGSQIYIADERLGCLVNLKENGELNFTYSALDLGHAAGIAVDNEGHIYVSGNTSNSVHVLSPNGERVKVIVTGQAISYPRAVAFEPREKKLLVTQGDQDIVKVYSLA